MRVDILEVRGQYEYVVGTRGAHVSVLYAVSVVLLQPLLRAFGTYPTVIRLFGEDLRLSSDDGEVGFRDLEDLGVVQFTVVCTMTECLESSFVLGFADTLIFTWERHAV